MITELVSLALLSSTFKVIRLTLKVQLHEFFYNTLRNLGVKSPQNRLIYSANTPATALSNSFCIFTPASLTKDSLSPGTDTCAAMVNSRPP